MITPCNSTAKPSEFDVQTALARYSEGLHKYTQQVSLVFATAHCFLDHLIAVVDGGTSKSGTRGECSQYTMEAQSQGW